MGDNFFVIRNGINFGSLSTAPSNPQNGDMYYDTGLNKFQKYENGSWGSLGSGSGGQNYITNPDFEGTVSPWVAYADAAQSRPVNGTGGSPVVTITRSTSSPLHGVASGLITKDAANRQGEGASVDITIDPGDQGKTMVLSFDYQIASGVFQAGNDQSQTDSDIIAYVYRTTATAHTIEPIGFRLFGSVVGVNYSQKCYFPTDPDATGYRIILHVATTSTAAYTLKIDNVSVSPQVINYSPIVTDWQYYTPTITGRTSNPTRPTTVDYEKMLWRRVGGAIELQWEYYAASLAGASAGVGVYDISLPDGYKIDPALVNIDQNSNTASGVGTCDWYSSSQARNFDGFCSASSSTTIALNAGANGFNAADMSNAFGPLNDTNSIRLHAIIPCVGLSANAIAPEQADPGTVALIATSTSSATASTTIPIVFEAVVKDTKGSYNSTTGRYTVPIAGLYNVQGCFFTGTTVVPNIYKNGTLHKSGPIGTSSSVANINALVVCVAGDILDIRPDSSVSMVNAAVYSYFDVDRIPDPAIIPASSKVYARYTQTSAQTITLNTATTVLYDVKDQDNFSAYNTSTGVFTAPRAGWYRFDACTEMNTVTTTNALLRFSKNGAGNPVSYGPTVKSTNNIHGSAITISASGGMYLVSGDTIQVEMWFDDSTANKALTANVGANVFSISSE